VARAAPPSLEAPFQQQPLRSPRGPAPWRRPSAVSPQSVCLPLTTTRARRLISWCSPLCGPRPPRLQPSRGSCASRTVCASRFREPGAACTSWATRSCIAAFRRCGGTLWALSRRLVSWVSRFHSPAIGTQTARQRARSRPIGRSSPAVAARCLAESGWTAAMYVHRRATPTRMKGCAARRAAPGRERVATPAEPSALRRAASAKCKSPRCRPSPATTCACRARRMRPRLSVSGPARGRPPGRASAHTRVRNRAAGLAPPHVPPLSSDACRAVRGVTRLTRRAGEGHLRVPASLSAERSWTAAMTVLQRVPPARIQPVVGGSMRAANTLAPGASCVATTALPGTHAASHALPACARASHVASTADASASAARPAWNPAECAARTTPVRNVVGSRATGCSATCRVPVS